MRCRRLPVDTRLPGAGRAPAFTKSLCTSINEVICHGIPDSTVLREGDIVNIDITAYLDGVHGDTDATTRRRHRRGVALLIERTKKHAARRPGRCARPALNAVGRVIESYARRFGYGVVRDFTGHGIGTTFHPAGGPPLRRARVDVIAAGHDVHDRTDADPRRASTTRSGRTDGRWSPRSPAQCPVRAHRAGDRDRR